MNDPAVVQRSFQLALLNRDVRIAIDATKGYVKHPYWAHMLWHNFPQHREVDVDIWGDQIEYTLIPALIRSPRWQVLVFDLKTFLKYLRAMDPEPKYGCGRCV